MKTRLYGYVISLFILFSVSAVAGPEEVHAQITAKNYDAAIALAKEHLANNPDDEKMWSSLVIICCKAKKFAEAKQNALIYLEKHPGSKSRDTEIVERYLAESYVALKDYDLVEPFVSKILAERPNHKYRNDLLFEDAKASLWSDSYEKAYDKYYKLANADPNDNVCRKSKYYVAYAAYKVADDMRKKGAAEDQVAKQYQLALDLCDAFRKANIADKNMWAQNDLRMIKCYSRLNKLDSLDEEVKKALSAPEHQADRGLILLEYGNSFFERQNWSKALECYDSALNWTNLAPANLKLMQRMDGDRHIDVLNYHRMLCLLNTGNETAFEQASTEFMKTNPNAEKMTRIAYARAMIPFRKENWPAAKTAFQAFLNDNAKASEELKTEAECNLVKSMLLADEQNQVKEYVRKKLEQAPDSAGRRSLEFLSAMADFRSGNWSASSASLNKLVEQSPEGEIASDARLYIGLCKLGEARKTNSTGSTKGASALKEEGRKSLIDWMKNQKPAVQTDMDALYYQDDFEAIKQVASKYLQDGSSSDIAKKAQMLNWMGLVFINQNPPDLQGGKKYFDEALQAARQIPEGNGVEAAKASAWNIWIALYNDDQPQAKNTLKELKSLRDSTAKSEALAKYQYVY
ncbi:MAG: hypothetical protein ABFD69_10430 [Candidatus Sumerlaeia bacterium]